MVRKPLYTFKDGTSTGFDEVPLNSMILVEDSDGLNNPRQFMLIDKTGVSGTTTASDVFANTLLWNPVNDSNTTITASSSITANSNDYILADTTAGVFTITLPLTPPTLTRVTILDNTTSFGTNNLTVSGNGETIMGLAEDILLDVDSKEYRFFYNGNDWRVAQ